MPAPTGTSLKRSSAATRGASNGGNQKHAPRCRRAKRAETLHHLRPWRRSRRHRELAAALRSVGPSNLNRSGERISSAIPSRMSGTSSQRKLGGHRAAR